MPKEEETETATSAHQSTDTGADAPRTRRTSSANTAEEKLEKILKANKRANLKVHEQEDRIMEELAMGMAVIDRDVEKVRRKRGDGLFEGQLLLFLFSALLVLMAVLTFYETFKPAMNESYRKTKVLLRAADQYEDVIRDSYPVCGDAYTSPWRRLTDTAAIRRIFGTPPRNASVYAYTRIVMVERPPEQWFPEAEDCPPSLLLLSRPLPPD